MTCKNCGYENKLGVRYCQRCGQYIEPKRTLAKKLSRGILEALLALDAEM